MTDCFVVCFALVFQNGITLSAASHFLSEFHKIFPSIRSAMQAMVTQVAKDGFVCTLFNRRRSKNARSRTASVVRRLVIL